VLAAAAALVAFAAAAAACGDVDPWVVATDGALLDALRGPDPSPLQGVDARLARVLMAWRDEVDTEAVVRLVATDTALAVVPGAHRSGGRP